MEQYIPKSALVAEIERLREVQPIDEFQPKEQNKIDWLAGKLFTINSLDFFLDTLEAKEEVDMEKEIKEVQRDYKTIDEYEGYPATIYSNDIKWIAEHFFELGMAVSSKAQKGENI